MICKFCSAEIDDDLNFCSVCGKSLKEDTENQESPTVEKEETITEKASDVIVNVKEHQKRRISVVSLIQLLCGLVFVFVGVISITNSDVSISSASFGADFYTYCYRGIRNCAELLSDISASMGCIITAFGCNFVFSGLKGLKK